MSIIKKLSIKNFLGIEEMNLDASKINIFKGPKGSGKSSIIEAIEKAFTNKNRRTEVIRHGEEEATIYLESDDGLTVDRRIRTEKSDYLKVRKDGEGNVSTEGFLRSLINGEIFRPIEWVNKSDKEQTQSILAMLEIGWSMEDIKSWFGEITSNIDYTQHILVILKSIETKYYKEREEVNRKIKELKTQIKVILSELPAEYDGEAWRNKKVQEYYNKVSEAQKINHWIEEAKQLQDSYEEKINSIKSSGENEKSRVNLKFRSLREDIKDIIDLSKSKIDKSKTTLENVDKNLEVTIQKIEADIREEHQKADAELDKTLKQIEEEYNVKIAEASNLHTARINDLDYKLEGIKESLKEAALTEKDTEKDNIHLQESKISTKQQELIGLDDLEKAELKAVDEKTTSEIEKEELRVGKAADYLKDNEPVKIEPLQTAADEVAEMQSYLRQWDMMISIRDKELAEKERDSAVLTSRIDKARELPSDLLKVANMPIEGISVDNDGKIRIGGTLINGLSDGEKLELAMKIAKAQAGELKVVCVDKFESLNPAAQQKLISEMAEDEYQYFITSTMSDEFEIEKIG